MKTTTSLEGHINLGLSQIKQVLPQLHRLEQIEIIAQRVVQVYNDGCSLADLEPLICNLGIAVSRKEKK